MTGRAQRHVQTESPHRSIAWAAMIRIVSWNMARRIASWPALHDVPADIALVQEASRPDPSWAHSLSDSSNPWETALVAGRGPWRTAVLRLSDAVELQARPTM